MPDVAPEAEAKPAEFSDTQAVAELMKLYYSEFVGAPAYKIKQIVYYCGVFMPSYYHQCTDRLRCRPPVPAHRLLQVAVIRQWWALGLYMRSC